MVPETYRVQLLAAAALVWLASHAVAMSRHATVTHDEPRQIAAGSIMLLTGDYPHLDGAPFGAETFPMLRKLTALALLPLQASAPAVLSSATLAQPNLVEIRFFPQDGIGVGAIFTAARLVNVGWGMLLAYTVWCFGKDLVGGWGGAMALWLLACTPTVIAYSGLVAPDAAVACLMMVALYVAWRWLVEPSWRTAVMAGLAIGLACASRVTGFLTLLLVGLWILDRRRQGGGWWAMRRLVEIALVGMCAVTVLGLAATGDPFYWYRRQITHGWSMYRQGTGEVLLFGRVVPQSSLLAFLVALVSRLPVPLLLLAALGLWGFRRHPWRRVVWAPVAICAAVFATSSVKAGIRYALLLVPMLCLAASGAVLWAREVRWRMALLSACGVWAAVAPLQVAPRYLAYTNELFGGPRNSHRVLVDAGSDWGQDLKELAAFQAAHPDSNLVLAYAGVVSPEAYGLRAQQVPLLSIGPICNDQGPLNQPSSQEYLAVSLSALRVHQEFSRLWPLLQQREPETIVGSSIWVWDITTDAEVHDALADYYSRVGFPRHAAHERQRTQRIREERG